MKSKKTKQSCLSCGNMVEDNQKPPYLGHRKECKLVSQWLALDNEWTHLEGKKPKVTIVECSDWQALYIDDEKKCENHTLRVRDVLEALGTKPSYIEISDEDAEEDGFPNNLENLSFKVNP